jgi:glycosyltransferase involved in cell wall biosynthesis
MKILYGITKSNFGGAQRYVYELAREAKHRGFDTAVVLGRSGPLREKLESRDIRVISLPSLGRDISILNDLRGFIALVKILRHERPDIFHVNSSKMGAFGSFAGRLMGVPKIVFTAHSFAFNENRPGLHKTLLKIIYWMIVAMSHETICVSEAVEDTLATWPFIKGKLALIHNGIMPFELLPREEARKKLGIKEETYVVGTIAELHRVKGLDILLTAWADFSKNRNVTLVIIGDGDEGENLNVLAKRLGISDSVYFAGFVDNARKFLQAFDVFVLASRSEGFPYAILEAGSASLPVVATAVGGIPEIILEDETGMLIQPEFPEELRHVLDGLRRDSDLRKRLGEALHTFVDKEFNMHTMFDKTFGLY